MANIAFLGLGNMGLPMAVNLHRAGHGVIGFDLSPSSRAQAAAAGISLAPDAPTAADGAECLITMLPAGAHVCAVYGSGVLTALAPGALAIDCSTIAVAEARAAHELAHAAGLVALDAPVSGGVGGATAGSLTFMCGGTDIAFQRAQPMLAAMGKRIVLCGEAGAGQAAKICNNMILGISMIAVAEAFVLAEKLGLSHQALFDVAANASGQCWSLTSYCPVPGPVPVSPANNEYKPGFATALMLKDLRLADEAAETCGANTELGHHAATLFARFAEAGGAGLDFSGIITGIRQGS